jgi:hypothetical protein
MVGRSSDAGRRTLGLRLFRAALPALADFSSPRAWAFALLGIDACLVTGEDGELQEARRALSVKLLELFYRTRTTDWKWFEDSLTYCNPRLSQALVVSGRATGNDEMTLAGLESLRWLVSVQFSGDRSFAPIGSNGFYRRGGERARFDQQPVEAYAMVSACLESRRATGDQSWTDFANGAFAWFLGINALRQSLYDPITGGCRDGLHEDRMNENQGAESTLAFLLALSEMRAADKDGLLRSTLEVSK